MAVSQYAAFSFRELLVSILLLLALALAGLLAGAPRAGAAACLAGFALAGAMRASLTTPPPDLAGVDLRGPMVLRGWVRVPPVARADRDQFVLEAESIGQGTGVRVTLIRRPGEPPLEVRYGERVELTARLRRPRNFENPGAFDWVSFLQRDGVHLLATVRPGAEIKRLEGRRGTRLEAALWRARQWTNQRTDALFGAGSIHAGVFKAMVLGDKAYLDHSLGVAFQRTGTYHALVVSGMHATLVAGFLLILLRWVRLPRVWAAALAMALVAAFVLLVGSQLPTVRGACMVGAYLIARLVYRHHRVLNIIAGTALGMLAFDPGDLFDAGFQLSFLSVALIAGIAAPILERTLEPYRLGLADLGNADRDMHMPPKIAQRRVAWRMAAERLPFSPRVSMAVLARLVRAGIEAAELLVVSASVQVGLTLPMVAYFHRVSWSGLSANLLVIPLMSLSVPLGFVALGTGWGLLGTAVGWLITAMIAVVEWHARLSWLEARVPDPPRWLAWLFAAGLVAVAVSFGRRRRVQLLAGLVTAAAFAALVAFPWAPHLTPGRLELTTLDVGQGDSLFLSLPQGQTLLVDGGGLIRFGAQPASTSLDIGEDVVSPYLWSRAIRRLDVVVISHAHWDHIGGLAALLANFRIGEVWVGNNPPDPDYDRVIEMARARGAQVVRLTSGDTRSLGGINFEVLAPSADYVPRSKPSNDDSLVLLARFRQRSFLLTGDVERNAERALSADIDVLKVPHHGSKTSTTELFLARTTPWFALVSAGFDNPYGHPHPDVLDRLARHNVRVLRTDLDGAVTVSTDGYRIFVSTHRWARGR